jgi:hypothetical protein
MRSETKRILWIFAGVALMVYLVLMPVFYTTTMRLLHTW